MQDKLKPIADFSDNDKPSIYVHVPFCARPCAYCKFYKQRPTHADIESYIEGIKAEADAFFESRENIKPKSIFFGGGTPTSLNEKQLEKLCSIFARFDSVEEWTVEASPSTVSADKLKALRDMGVNRLSLGVQSFDEATLKELGRAHSTANALNAIDEGLAIFDNMNIDLIFGNPNQTEAMWQKDLAKAVSYPFKHISAYCLEFESSTSCCAGIEKPMPDQERETDFFETTIETMQNSGFGHYEISNYAKEGFECLQNINTWRMGSWVGFGPSAASQIEGVRRQNPQNLESWLKGVSEKNIPYENIVALDDEELFSSALIFGLRMRSGVNFEYLKKRFPAANHQKYATTVSFLLKENLLEEKDGAIQITRTGLNYADAIAVELL